jgi:hypothetical protein
MKIELRLPSLLLRLAVAHISFSTLSCTGPGKFDPGPLQDAAVSITVSKVVKNSSEGKRAGRVALIREVADAIDGLAAGEVNQGAVDDILNRILPTDPEVKLILRPVILGYFPAVPAPDPDGKLAALARRVAAAIRAGLPLDADTAK